MPVDPAEPLGFLWSWRSYGVDCWEGLIDEVALELLPEVQGECRMLGTTPDDGPLAKGYDLLRQLVSFGPAGVAPTSFREPGTCPQIWLDTSHAFLALEDEAERTFTVPVEVWLSETDAGIVADSLTYLATPRSEADCEAPIVPVGRDLLDFRIDLAADAAEYDRELGGWFGRAGGQTTDILTAGTAASTWNVWRWSALQAAIQFPESCYDGLVDVFDAANWLEDAAWDIWNYAWGRGEVDVGTYERSVDEALDRQVPRALAILETCGQQ
jgi:hypothetical protein